MQIESNAMARPSGFVPNDAITLGVESYNHLGDCLCTTPVPRLLCEGGNRAVFVSEEPNCRVVFANNPYVNGYGPGGIPLFAQARGNGHWIQRIQQGLDLPIDSVPKPELFLSQSEVTWAARQRQLLPPSRSVCVLSTSAVSDCANLEQVDWASVVEGLSERYTVVQPVLGEAGVPGAIVLRNLPVRLYIALVAVADCFVGGTSGGSHVAAAFDVPALVVCWRSLLDHVRFPVSGLGPQAAFLYPQQWFIASEDLTFGHFRRRVLHDLLTDLALRGRSGRPTNLGSHPTHPCGFAAAPSRYTLMTDARRFVRVPGLPGDGGKQVVANHAARWPRAASVVE